MSAAAVHPVYSPWKEAQSAPHVPVRKKNTQTLPAANQPAKQDDAPLAPKRGEEQLLVRRAIKGDTQAQDTLFGRYRSRLYRLALRLLRAKKTRRTLSRTHFSQRIEISARSKAARCFRRG